MNNIVNLVLTVDMQGCTGGMDSLNHQYIVKAKQSIFAKPEQNRKLEEGLMKIYKTYLEEVANSNNGMY